MKKLLSIAGSDSSGGAGIQADLKTFAALGTYGMTCICALTAQNTEGVTAIQNAEPSMVTAQLEAIYSDVPPNGVKTGMLSTPAIVTAVADFLETHKGPPVVVDPVMVATSGAVLLEDAAIAVYKERLFRCASLITPNLPEAEVLTGMSISSEEDMKKAAIRLMDYGPKAVLVKGGHLTEDAVDILFDGEEIHRLPGKRIDTKNTHGTGCTLSSALAVMLAKGLPVAAAAAAAKKYLAGAIEGAVTRSVGHGHGPVDHFWFYGDSWGKTIDN